MIRRLAVLGFGKMGQILVRGLIESPDTPSEGIVVTDLTPERAQANVMSPRVRAAASNPQAAAWADAIVLSVKPNDVAGVLEEIAGSLRAGRVIVSIAAGVTTSFIQARVPEGVWVVRAMPNVAAQVGKAITALCAGAGTGSDALDLAEQIFSRLGQVIRVPEDQMDAVTAISGSGPAYFAFVAEVLIEAGRDLGLAEADAAELVAHTLLGTGAMLDQTGAAPADLRAAVTSPGGTTEAAVAELEKAGVRRAFEAAVRAAAARSKQLSRG